MENNSHLNDLPQHPTSEGDEIRNRLLLAAEEVFAELGYEGATTREICHRAEVKNVGAINYYFQGKEKLYWEVVTRAMKHCCGGIEGFPVWPENLPPLEKLRGFIHTMLKRLFEIPRPSATQLMMREMTRSEVTEVAAHSIRQNIKPLADLLRSIIAELLPEFPEMQQILIGKSIIGQCLYYHQNRAANSLLFPEMAQSISIDELAEHIVNFSLAAIGKGPVLTPKLHGREKA